MNSFLRILKTFRSYIWYLNEQTEKLIKMNPTGALQFSSDKILEGEKEAAVPGREKGLSVDDNRSNGNGNRIINRNGDSNRGYSAWQKIGLWSGPLAFVFLILLPMPGDLSPEAQGVLASTAWIAFWWISEAVPMPATSLLPLVLFPLTGAVDSAAAALPYANRIIFLFLGGFMIAVTLEKWNLHKRIALKIIQLIGTSPARIILGFMVATAFLSMWISNTATAMMMMPIGLAVVVQFDSLIKEGDQNIDIASGKFKMGAVLMLGITYAASIGGVATIIGTPPNTVLAGVVNEMFNQDIGFFTWMMYGVPVSVIFLILTWIYLIKVAFPVGSAKLPGGKALIDREYKNLGVITGPEKSVLGVFLFTTLSWILREPIWNKFFPMVHDSTIAIFGAVLLFLIPVNLKKGEFLLDWKTAVKIPWGTILLFGGGLSIADAFSSTGLARWMAGQLTVLDGASTILIMFAVVTLVIFLTEITSNTATSTMMMPIMAAMAAAMKIHPYSLMITAATAASFAFMLPVATPPNAIAYSTGYISMSQMARTGFWLNILGIIIITLITTFWLPISWGIDINTLPVW